MSAMLLSFRAANHRSLRDEQQLLLLPAYSSDTPSDTPWQALTVAGIFGANASGKSNVIDALAYMTAMVRRSFRENEPGEGVTRYPFALDPVMSDEPSVFVVDVELAGVRHTYGFAVDDTRVVEEWLYSYPRGRRRNIYHRREDEYSYGEHSPQSLRQAEQLTEPNILFLSVAVRLKQDVLRPVYDWFGQVANLMRTSEVLRFPNFVDRADPWLNDLSNLDRLTSLLRAADTGIESAEVAEESEEDYTARMAQRRRPGGRQPALPRRKWLLLRHRGAQGDVTLRLRDQSVGTRALCELAIPAFRAIDSGLPFVVDELDSSLHPFLTAQIIALFRDPQINPLGAQLIFTSHDVSLLGRIQGEQILQRDHIWFTEKDDSGATQLFPLSDFKPRKDENRERRYLAGRYGAVPVVNDELFAAALAARTDADDVAPDA